MAPALWQLASVVFPAIAILHLNVSPYTKVEESFNIQAIHDILEYGVPISDAASKFKAYFDHMTFPGAVPRTFIGSLVVSGLAKPEIWLRNVAGKAAQHHVRAVLGGMNGTAMAIFARAVERAYGPIAATWYVVLQASQFHLWYYASRTLPNMFAFFLSTISLAYLLPNPTSSLGPVRRTRLGLYLMTIATVIFRSELAMLLGAHCLWLLLKPQTLDAKVSLVRTTFVPSIIPGALIALLLTVGIDSYFWRSPSPLWPEFSAFLSNVFPKEGSQGASEWGTQPFYWYLAAALPRLLMNQIFMVDLFFFFPSTWQDLRILDNLIPSYAYLLLYSILPHKETRFMFPIVPSLTLVAALTCTRLTINAHKSAITKLLLYVAIISTIVTAFVSHAILLPLSAQNYPGGRALESLYEYYYNNREGFTSITETRGGRPEIHVHLTNLALQSGVTRFLEQPPSSEPVLEELVASVVGSIQVSSTGMRDPIILPGDANHPALTIRPQAPTPSASAQPDKRRFRDPLWIYDKSSNDTAFLTPEFWSQFDFVIVEDPSLAIGAWDIVQEIKAVGRPRVLQPGGTRSQRYGMWSGWDKPDQLRQYWTTPDQTDVEEAGTTALLHAMFPPYIAAPVANMHNMAYDIIVCGKGLPRNIFSYWFEVPLETKLFILQRAMSGIEPNQGRIGSSVVSTQRPAHRSTHAKGKAEKGEAAPALPEKASTDQIPIDFGGLGPLVVNKDGTLSRLDNWAQMNAQERKKTIEYLKKRNMIRLEGVETVAQ